MRYAYVLYVDVLLALLLANFLFDYLLLWATGSVARRKSNITKLSLGATLGTIYFLLVHFANAGLLPEFGILRFPPLVLAVGAAMIGVAYSPKNWRQFLRLSGYFAGIGLVAGGAGLATAYVTGTENQPDVFWGTIAAVAAILLIAELGWGIVHKRIWERLYLVPLEISLFGRTLRVDALIDTGNRLQDPISGRPVVVVELDSLKAAIPPDIAQALRSFGDNDFATLEPLTEHNDWAARFCLIPFSTLSDHTRLMPGIRPDYVNVMASGETVTLHRVILGICLRPLDQAGHFHALVPPEILEAQSSKQKYSAQPEILATQKGESVNA